jgi:hypothetical protein
MAHHKKKLKLWRLPKIEDSMERWGAIGDTLGEHIVNLRNILGTSWELIGNLKGTFWEQRKNEKSFPPPKKT